MFVILSEVGKMDLEKEAEKYKSGNQTSFDKIYYATKDLVRYAIYTIIPNRHIIEDLVQDTYVKVAQALPKYQTKNFRAWIYLMAKNTALDYVKKRKEHTLDEVDFYPDEKSTHPYLYYAIRHLQEQEREVFLMKVLCGHTTKRISEILNIKPFIVNQYYSQAKQKLKNSLKDDEI